MSRLDSAAERFHAALESLDKQAAPLSVNHESMKDVVLRLANVTAERDKLRARVAKLEEESRSLNFITHEVEGRLDGAIAEIRAALGR